MLLFHAKLGWLSCSGPFYPQGATRRPILSYSGIRTTLIEDFFNKPVLQFVDGPAVHTICCFDAASALNHKLGLTTVQCIGLTLNPLETTVNISKSKKAEYANPVWISWWAVDGSGAGQIQPRGLPTSHCAAAAVAKNRSAGWPCRRALRPSSCANAVNAMRMAWTSPNWNPSWLL